MIHDYNVPLSVTPFTDTYFRGTYWLFSLISLAMLKLSGLNAQKTPGLSPQGPLPAFLTTCPSLSSIRTLCAMCDSLVYFCGTPRVMKLGVFFLSAWQKVATEWWIWAFYRGLLWSCSARHQHQVILHISPSQAESPEFPF